MLKKLSILSLGLLAMSLTACNSGAVSTNQLLNGNYSVTINQVVTGVITPVDTSTVTLVNGAGTATFNGALAGTVLTYSNINQTTNCGSVGGATTNIVVNFANCSYGTTALIPGVLTTGNHAVNTSAGTMTVWEVFTPVLTTP